MKGFMKHLALAAIALTIGLGVALLIFIWTFDLFPSENKKVTEANCDSKGIRKAVISQVEGNAVTSSTISVSVHLGCKKTPNINEESLIFLAEQRNEASVEVTWLTFDSLEVAYSRALEPVTIVDEVLFRDTTLNLTVLFRENALTY